jgi:hypothetical protein
MLSRLQIPSLSLIFTSELQNQVKFCKTVDLLTIVEKKRLFISSFMEA